MELKVEGRRPVGRPKKTWSKGIENSGGNSYCIQPKSEKLGTLISEDDDDSTY